MKKTKKIKIPPNFYNKLNFKIEIPNKCKHIFCRDESECFYKMTNYNKKSISQLKKLADKYFSLSIRKKYSDWKGNTKCFTCDKTFPLKEIQCGHYISRVYSNLRYSEKNCRPQCYSCNIMKRGAMDEFAIRLERETPGILEELNKWKYMPSSLNTRQDLISIIEKYKEV